MAGEAAVCDHVVALGDDQLVLVFQRSGQRADQVEQSIAAGRNVGAVLEVAFRPEPLGGVVVPLVEQRVEGLEDERLVLFRCGLGHGDSPMALGYLERDRRRAPRAPRSEEHTSELQSQSNLVCRLLLEKKTPLQRLLLSGLLGLVSNT